MSHLCTIVRPVTENYVPREFSICGSRSEIRYGVAKEYPYGITFERFNCVYNYLIVIIVHLE